MMNLSNYIDTRFPEHKDKIYEFLRFCIVGTIAAGIHYGIYCLLQMYIEVNILCCQFLRLNCDRL